MSASSSLARTRSLRRPAATGESRDAEQPLAGDLPRNASPSRLPVKPPSGLARAASVSTRPAATSSSSGALAQPRTGPLSKIGLRNPRPLQHHAVPATDKPAPTGIATMRRPTNPPLSSATSAPRSIGGHYRSKSNATTLTEATTLVRPTPSSSSASPSISSHVPAASASTSHSRPPPVMPQPRAIHRRAPSNPVTARALEQPQLPSQPQQVRVSKPAFNNMQQHFSPLKTMAPKPLTSTFLAPPSPSKLPVNLAISAETSRLQTELLQLHLLHREAGPVAARWHASARARLAQRFDAVAKAYTSVAHAEGMNAEEVNARALEAWVGVGGPHGGLGLEERVQALDAAVSGIWALSEPGGRHARVVRQFEKWLERLRLVTERRENGEFDLDGEFVFVSELDADWHDECASLARKLDAWYADLRQLDDLEVHRALQAQPLPGEDGSGGEARTSSLAAVLSGFRLLAQDMLEELSFMEKTEGEALKQEDEWIEKIAKDDAHDDVPRAGAIWRVL